MASRFENFNDNNVRHNHIFYSKTTIRFILLTRKPERFPMKSDRYYKRIRRPR